VFFINLIAALLLLASSSEQLDEAKDLIRLGRYLEAIGVCREIAQLSDDPLLKAKAQLLIADTVNVMLDRPEEALKEYSRLISDYPESDLLDDALYRSALLLYRLGRYEEAIELIERLQREFSGRAESFYNVYNSRLLLEKCKEAMREKPERPPEPPKPMPRADTVKVAILNGVILARVSCDSEFTVEVGSNSKRMRLQRGERIEISAYGGTLHLTPPDLFADSISIHADGDPGLPLSVNGIRYRGELRFYPVGDSLLIVNELPLEEYLYGVLPMEVPASWHIEALKAQAVAARTFALSRKRNSKNPLYDLDDTGNSQVYGGADAETEILRRAVDETKGEVMFFGDKLVTACYHSNSGGITANSSETWGVGLPYLVSVKDPYSRNSPVYRWRTSIPRSTLEGRLSDLLGIPNLKVRAIRVVDRDSTGRAKVLEIRHSGGRSRVSARRFRRVFGTTRVKSTLFDLKLMGDRLEVSGYGYGHGVGMSQWGAQNMALKGMSYREILGFYYPGVRIVRF
jgi:stage II sporulation protein D